MVKMDGRNEAVQTHGQRGVMYQQLNRDVLIPKDSHTGHWTLFPFEL